MQSERGTGVVMETESTPKNRWRWRQVSPRRVIGQMLEGFGIVFIVNEALTYGRGRWDPSLDPSFVVAGVVMLVVGFAVLWRVKPAPWP